MKNSGKKDISNPKPLMHQMDYSASKDELNNFFMAFNKIFQANLAQVSMGVSPAALASAYCAWGFHWLNHQVTY